MSLSTARDLQGGLPPCSMGIYKGESSTARLARRAGSRGVELKQLSSTKPRAHPLVRTKGLVLGTIGPLS